MTSLTAEVACPTPPQKGFRAHCLERLMERYTLSDIEATEVMDAHERLFKYDVGLELMFKGSTVGSLVYKIKPSLSDPNTYYPVRKYYPNVKKFLLITYLRPDQVASTLRKIDRGLWEPWVNN